MKRGSKESGSRKSKAGDTRQTARRTARKVTLTILQRGAVAAINVAAIPKVSLRQKRGIQDRLHFGGASLGAVRFLVRGILVFPFEHRGADLPPVHVSGRPLDVHPIHEVAIVCGRAIIFTDTSLSFKSAIEFKDYGHQREPVDVNGDQSCEFLAYRHMDTVWLVSHEGKVLWDYGSDRINHNYIDGVASGDVDGDGIPEFAIYHKYSRGIHLLDAGGAVKWRRPVQTLQCLAMADINQDGRSEIVYTSGVNIMVLNGDSSTLCEFKNPSQSYYFTIINWPDKKGTPHIVSGDDGKMKIIDFKGDTVAGVSPA